MVKFSAFTLLMFVTLSYCASKPSSVSSASTEANSAVISKEGIRTGAEQTEEYLSYLKGKRIAILGNQTSIIGKTHLVDSLKKLGINIVTVFGPEHGFRGNASAGTKVQDEVDSATGIRIISLYGPKRKPSKEDMAIVDLMIYDVQDVGCRFYTNINALANLMRCTLLLQQFYSA